MSIRNTDHVIGVVVYTGHDTKIMQNSAQAKYKFSMLEKYMNKSIILIFILQFTFAFLGAINGSIYSVNKKNMLVFLEGAITEGEDANIHSYLFFLIQLSGTWILIFVNFVPISLMLTFELVKFWQAIFMT